MIEFKAWPKTPRLNRDMVITEKIDGTNAAVIVTEDGEVAAQSRNRLIYPGKETDNAGFAGWVAENVDQLRELGPGHHYGEWWGQGIQRNYGLSEKRFSLFDTNRWHCPANNGPDREDTTCYEVPCCHVVPVLRVRTFKSDAIDQALSGLRLNGSAAAPGFPHPEGVIVFHTAARVGFKYLIENDDIPKGLAA